MAKPMVHFRLEGDVKTGLRFEEFPDDLRAELKDEIDALGREAFGKIAARIPRKSGRLASEERLTLTEGSNFVRSVVDFDGAGAQASDHAKAAALEYGSRGEPVSVKAHQRRIDNVFGRALRAPMEKMIRAYQRTPHIAERDFVRGVTRDMQAEAIQRLEAIAARATDNFNNSND